MKRYVKLFIVFFSTLCIMGCSDFLDVDIPYDQLDESKVFKDDRMATSAVVGIYSKLRNNGFFSGTVNGMGVQLGCYSDELEVTTAQSIDYRFFYENTITPSSTAVKSLWDNAYQQIFATNSVIEGIGNSQTLTESVRKQLLGETLAIRALLHFYLCQTYGRVPYVISTDYNKNKSVFSLLESEVMDLVVKDLKNSEQLLLSTYPSGERVRFNQVAAQALLSRVYLYQENWELAQQYAEKVIESPGYMLETLDRTFLKESTSAILQLKPGFEGGNSTEAAAYIFNVAPAPNLKLSQQVLKAFESDDNRKNQYIRFVGEGTSNAHVYKYKTLGNTSASLEYSILLRLEEQYLIAAEAAAELNNWDACTEMINVLRSRAGLGNVIISNKEEALNSIFKERRIELLCEYGHRFYDLKRRNRLEELVISKPNWQSHFTLLPLPENELLLNPNLLPQNKGY